MKIREVNQKAENLIEQGENAKQRQIHYQQAANSARSQLMAAYARLEAASETDEDGEPVGDVAGAQAEIYAAQAFLASAESGLMEATQQLDGINQQKLDAVQEIERYESVEEHNLSILAQLQKKQFGTNAAAFMADLAAKMNSSEQMRQQLLQSMGMSAASRSFSAGGASGGNASGVGTTPQSTGPSDQWMNQFNAAELSQKLSQAEYRHQLQLYRQGLSRELGEARVSRMTDDQIEILSNHRSSYIRGGQPFDTKQFVQANFLDVISDGNYADHIDPSEYNPKNRTGLLAAISGNGDSQRKLSFEDDNHSAQVWFDRKFKPNINEKERDSLQSYTGVTAYSLNETLYKNRPINSYQQELITNIDSALSKNTLPDDVVVYRCVDDKALLSSLNASNIPSLQKGIAFKMPAYSSTSVCSNNDYLDKRPHLNYVLKLTAKKGTNAVPLENITHVKNEYELLFGRNSKVHVKNVYRGKRSDLSKDLSFGDKEVVIIEGIIH